MTGVFDTSKAAHRTGAPARRNADGKHHTQQRIRIRFSKTGDIRFISHLDLVRLLERGMRRARLPVAFSEGFNPHPRFSMALSLATGFAGVEEVLDVIFDHPVDPDLVARKLSAATPEGIAFHSTWEVGLHDRPRVRELEYEVTPRALLDIEQADLDALMARDSAVLTLMRGSKKRVTDVRESLIGLDLSARGLRMRARLTARGVARPDDVLRALGVALDGLPVLITRTRVVLEPAA